MELRKYQKRGVGFLVKRKCALLADDMGLGKTAQIITAAERVALFPWVIVCPSSVKYQWEREIHRWSADFIFTQVIESGKTQIHPAMAYIMSYKMADYFCENYPGQIGVLVVDESHYCKNWEAQRTRTVLGKYQLAGRAQRVWAMTGTPIFNRPVDLYPIMLAMNSYALTRHTDGSPESFAIRYNGAWTDRFGRQRLGRPQNIEELKKGLQPFMLRRMKKDVLDELPPVSVNMVEIDVDCNELKRLNDKYGKTKERDVKQDLVRDPRGEQATLRKKYALAKITSGVKYIEHELLKCDKIVIFTYHREVAEKLHLHLRKYGPVVYQGGMSDKEKSEALAVFGRKECRVFIGQIRAAGTGLDGLQHHCSRGIFFEWDLAPGAVSQTTDRLNRLGQSEPVYITFLVGKGSVQESDSVASLLRKRSDVKNIIG